MKHFFNKPYLLPTLFCLLMLVVGTWVLSPAGLHLDHLASDLRWLALGFAFLFCLFCWLGASVLHFDEVAWARVDYLWLALAVLALVLQHNAGPAAALLLMVAVALRAAKAKGEILLKSRQHRTLWLVVDGCLHAVHHRATAIPLARRPVLFALVRTLAEAWPQDAPRDTLMLAAFRIRHPDETHRARLRVEMGRLRTLLRGAAGVRATPRGFQLVPHDGAGVAVLARPVDDDHAAVLALLADGEAWSSSALALALDTSQRTVQRALEALAASGKIQAFGQGRARRWAMLPLPGFATNLLLPAALGVS